MTERGKLYAPAILWWGHKNITITLLLIVLELTSVKNYQRKLLLTLAVLQIIVHFILHSENLVQAPDSMHLYMHPPHLMKHY